MEDTSQYGKGLAKWRIPFKGLRFRVGGVCVLVMDPICPFWTSQNKT